MITNPSGGLIVPNAYDEYGVPKTGNGGRMMYTGQMWIPDLGAYYYKNRFYQPNLGTFLQADPMGYTAGMNLYGYVGGDPVNRVDPTGNTACWRTIREWIRDDEVIASKVINEWCDPYDLSSALSGSPWDIAIYNGVAGISTASAPPRELNVNRASGTLLSPVLQILVVMFGTD